MPARACLVALLLAALCGCNRTREPIAVTIEEIGDAFIDPAEGNAAWGGKRVVITGGKVDLIKRDFLRVLGQTTDGSYLVELICYDQGTRGPEVARALRGQPVTVTGRAITTKGGANALIRLEDCTFELGDPPPGKPEPATKSRGRLAAERDLEAGKMRLRVRIKRTGPPSAEVREYQRLLKEKYGIDLDVLREAGPIHGLSPDDRSYNKVMTAAIEKRFGRGVVEKVRKQARAGRKDE